MNKIEVNDELINWIYHRWMLLQSQNLFSSRYFDTFEKYFDYKVRSLEGNVS